MLDGQLLRRLEKLNISSKVSIRGSHQGKRRSKQLGSSMDFSDYRLYSPGDDIRNIDWNAYGRTSKPFVKLFMDEQELQVHLWIDQSKSMDFGGDREDEQKLEYAKKLAAAVGYISLCSYDRVGALFFNSESNARLPLVRGKGSLPRLLQFMADQQAFGEGDLESSLLAPPVLPRFPGMVWIFSDFLYDKGIYETLSRLKAAGQQVYAVQVLAEQELRPRWIGDLQLIDSESSLGKEVSMSKKVLRKYEAELQAHTEALQKWCSQLMVNFVQVNTAAPLEQTILYTFRNIGWLDS